MNVLWYQGKPDSNVIMPLGLEIEIAQIFLTFYISVIPSFHSIHEDVIEKITYTQRIS